MRSYWKKGDNEDTYFARIDLWGKHKDWLVNTGMSEQQARGLVGRVIRETGDLVKADWTFRRVKADEPKRGQIVAFLMQDIRQRK